MKQEIGDRVTIKKDLVQNELHGLFRVSRFMMGYTGQTGIITRVDDDDYLIKFEDGKVLEFWTDSMIEKEIKLSEEDILNKMDEIFKAIELIRYELETIKCKNQI